MLSDDRTFNRYFSIAEYTVFSYFFFMCFRHSQKRCILFNIIRQCTWIRKIFIFIENMLIAIYQFIWVQWLFFNIWLKSLILCILLVSWLSRYLFSFKKIFMLILRRFFNLWFRSNLIIIFIEIFHLIVETVFQLAIALCLVLNF